MITQHNPTLFLHVTAHVVALQWSHWRYRIYMMYNSSASYISLSVVKSRCHCSMRLTTQMLHFLRFTAHIVALSTSLVVVSSRLHDELADCVHVKNTVCVCACSWMYLWTANVTLSLWHKHKLMHTWRVFQILHAVKSLSAEALIRSNRMYLRTSLHIAMVTVSYTHLTLPTNREV